MKKLHAFVAVLVIGSVAACGDLPFEPQVDDTITVEQRGHLGSNNNATPQRGHLGSNN